MSVKIISDSTCDLSKELIEKYKIEILPLHVILGERECLDGIDISPDEIYRWADENRSVPGTSAPSITETMQLLQKCGSDGSEIVCFSISEKMSTTANVMRLAAKELGIEERVFVVDSENLSTGVGLLVLEAATMALEGRTAVEIVAQIQKLRPCVRASFVVDTLIYLQRGGRCGSVTALAGSALKLHPRIVVSNGEMQTDRKYRGKMEKVLLNYADDLKPQLLNARRNRVFVTHSGCSAEIVELVCQHLKALDIFEEILVTRAGSVISSHCGPGTLGVLFIERG